MVKDDRIGKKIVAIVTGDSNDGGGGGGELAVRSNSGGAIGTM